MSAKAKRMWAVPKASVAYCVLAAAKLIPVTCPKTPDLMIELQFKAFKT